MAWEPPQTSLIEDDTGTQTRTRRGAFAASGPCLERLFQGFETPTASKIQGGTFRQSFYPRLNFVPASGASPRLVRP
ncbi:hypothetical protein [Microseira wollei]|uniref:hypothetical protein n=1 Tax=Microseira wollei TaxID=467598 RepID=UPI001CFEBCB6|nr:hypothetical protein [Microseira wollei]